MQIESDERRAPSIFAVLFAKDAMRLGDFYESVLGAVVLHTEASHVVLQVQERQFVLHAIPEEIARDIVITSPPAPREEAAIKLIFPVLSIEQATRAAEEGGGVVYGRVWESSDARVRDVVDPEGNVFQLSEALR